MNELKEKLEAAKTAEEELKTLDNVSIELTDEEIEKAAGGDWPYKEHEVTL